MSAPHPLADPDPRASSDPPVEAPSEWAAANAQRGIDEPLATLVPDWLSLEDAAERLGISVSRVKVLARDHDLAVAGSRGGWIPALFIAGTEVVRGLPGTLTLLFDAGYDRLESIQWLYTADDSLPGRPIDALCENRGTEVRRRAQALGF